MTFSLFPKHAFHGRLSTISALHMRINYGVSGRPNLLAPVVSTRTILINEAPPLSEKRQMYAETSEIWYKKKASDASSWSCRCPEESG